MYDREQLIEELKRKTLQVTFTKVNGEQRVMTCTLDPMVVPPVPEPKQLAEGQQPRVKKPNDAVVSVWDINAVGWRSFRIDNVTDVTDAV